MVNGTTRPRLQTAKWGAACGTCAAAKAKCLRTNPIPGSKCERCDRLLKDCTDQIHRPRKKRTVKPSKTAQLEEKLDGLVHLLKQNGSLNSSGLSSDSISIPDELASVLSAQQSGSASSPESLGFSSSSKSWAIPDTYNSEAPASCICRPDCSDAPPPPASDDVLLGIFRDELQNVCPFVIVPPEVTASDLRTSKPFLMAAIRMVASYRSLKSMRAQMYHLMRYISDHMLLRSERSLDLLMGLLVIIQWYPYHFCAHSQLGNIVSLTTSLTSQLGLNRRPMSQERIGLRFLKPPEAYRRTNEERRAYVGAWFLASVCSLGFWRMEPMAYTRYLDECLNELELNGEYETDVKLVHLVRTQCLSHQISQISWTDTDMEDVNGPDLATREANLAAFEVELKELRDNVPVAWQDDAMIRMHLSTAALKLHEPPIVDRSMITSLCAAITSTGIGQASPLDQLRKSRHALVGWFENWLSIPPANFYQEATGGAAQLTYAIVMLGRWTKLTTPRAMVKGFKNKGQDTGGPPIDHPVGDCLQGTQVSTKIYPPTTVPGPMRSAAKLPFSIGQVTSRQEADPRLPLELAALRAHIEAQPGLAIDVAELITNIISRFELVNAAIQDVSVDPGKVGPNVWSMGAIRVRITRANLERWAELITEGIEKASLNDNSSVDLSTPSSQGQYSGSGLGVPDGYGMAWTSMLHSDQGQADGFGQPDMMAQDFDPNIWIQGSWDWDAMINSMGFMEP